MKENVTRIRVLQPNYLPQQMWCTSICEIISGKVPYSGIYISELTSIIYEARETKWMWGGSGSRRRSQTLENRRQHDILLDFFTSDPSGKLSSGEILLLTEVLELSLQEEPLPELTEEEKLIIAESFAQAKEERS